jgi:Cysteine-rich CPCC
MKGVSKRRWPCPCCGYRTLGEEPPGSYLICPVCFWEDDAVQFDEPDRRGGANGVSLDEARNNFRAFGASDERAKHHVRRPRKDEQP